MKKDIQKRNNVTIKGNTHQSKTIIFAPGFGCDQTVWNDVTNLVENDFRIVLFDYVGMGQTDITAFDKNKYNHLSGYVQDVLDVCSSLQLRDVIFVGHSVSGMIGLLASIQHPEYFSNLIMIGPSPCYLNDPPEYYGGFEKDDLIGLMDMMEKNYLGWATVFASTVSNNSNRPDVTKDLDDRFCNTDPIVARTFAEACFFADNRKDLPNVTVPSLIMQCAQDIIAPLEVGAYINQHAPDSKLVYMDAIGHCPHMSNPEETVSLILQYLNDDGLFEGNSVHE